jgi:hypothetical protein
VSPKCLYNRHAGVIARANASTHTVEENTVNQQSAKSFAASFNDEIHETCSRIVAVSGERVTVSSKEAGSILDGRMFMVRTEHGDFPFWIGINGPRLFFIAYIADIDEERAKSVFRFCFGGAEKVGWQVNYQEIDGGVSLWATCMTSAALPLTLNGFWGRDIALMVQAWIHTCEREQIQRHKLDPVPL